MTRTVYNFLILIGILVQVACRNPLYTQQVVNLSDSSQALPARWQHALREASVRSISGGYWVGYSIKKLMPENSFIGSYSSDPIKNKPSLRDVITGINMGEHWTHGKEKFEGEFNGEFSFEGGGNHARRIVKEIGVLIHLRNDDKQEIDEVRVSNLSLHVNLYGDPLIWIGNGAEDESVDLLSSEYGKTSSRETRKGLIMAVGIHSPTEKVFQFLRSILLGPETGMLRKEAGFWLGQCDLDEAVALLEHRAEEDMEGEVREQSVVVLGEMTNGNAVESLIRLARNARSEKVRKTAAFWLGQRASKKIAAAGPENRNRDDDVEIKKKAVFALYELPDAGGVQPLIDVAETNQNILVRREAIFWLSQIDMREALDALIHIVRN